MTENTRPDELVKTSDELDDQDKSHDAAAQEEDEKPGHDLESGADGVDGDDDTVGEEVEHRLPGAAFQK